MSGSGAATIGTRRRWRRAALVSGVVLGAVLALWAQREAKAALSCTRYWTGATSTNYATAGNWSLNADGTGTAPAFANTDVACESTAITNTTITLAANRTIGGANLPTVSFATNGFSLTVNTPVGETSIIHNLDTTQGSGTGRTIGGSGALSLTGTVDLDAAIIAGAGEKTLAGTANIVTQLDIGKNGTTAGNVGKLKVAGSLSWGDAHILLGGGNATSGPSYLEIAAGGTMEANNGGFSIIDNHGSAVVVPRVRVAAGGSFVQDGASSSSHIGVGFDNDGTVNVDGGHLYLDLGDAGLAHAGDATIAAGAVYDFNSGEFTWSGGADFTGDGTLAANATKITANGANDIENLAKSYGELAGTGALSVSSAELSGGSITGTGSVTFGDELAVTGAAVIDGRDATIASAATATVVANAYLQLQNGATLDNDGTYEMTGDNAYFVYTPTFDTLFTNDGTLRRVSGTGVSYLYGEFDNDGTVEVDTGTLQLVGSDDPTPPTWTGDVTTAGGATIQLASGTVNLDTGADFGGAGVLHLQSGTINASGSRTVSNMAQSGGTWSGTDTLNVTSLDWSGGQHTGAGTTNVTSSLDVSGFPTVATDRTVTIASTASAIVASAHYPTLASGAHLVNNGTYEVQGDATYAAYSPALDGTFDNNGTLKRTGAGSSHIYAQYDNDGLVQVEAGVLHVQHAGGATAPHSHAGDVTVAAASTYRFGGGSIELESGADVTGAGTFELTAGTVSGAGTNTVSNLTHVGGTWTGDGTLNVAVLDLQAGQLTGSGLTNVTSSFTQSTACCAVVNARTLKLATGATGGITTGWGLELNGGATLVNDGTFDLRDDHDTVVIATADEGTVVNNGLLTRTTGTTALHISAGVDVTNNGTIQIDTGQSGTNGGMGLFVDGTLTNVSGSTLSGGGYVLTRGLGVNGGAITTLDADVELRGSLGKLTDTVTTDLLSGNLASVTSDGSLTVTNRSLTVAGGAFTNAGAVDVNALTGNTTLVVGSSYTQTSGSTRLEQSAGLTAHLNVGAGAPVAIAAGTVSGNGSITGNVSGAGLLAPGLSPGILSITGNYTPGVLSAEIAGTTAGSGHDQVTVTGTASLGAGTLSITTDPAHTPAVGNTYTILTAASVTGMFASVSGDDLPDDLYYDVIYNPTSVVLEVKPLPTFTIDSPSVAEPNAGTTLATFTVTRSAPSSRLMSVNWATAEGSATDPEDYTDGSGSVSFAHTDGLTKTFTVSVASDLLDEDDETFTASLSDPVKALLGTPASGTATITDDAADLPPTVSIVGDSDDEGDSGTTALTFDVSLSAASGRRVSVPFTVNHVDTTTADLTVVTDTPLVFPAGTTSGTVTVNIHGDTAVEDDETFTVDLGTPTNATLHGAQATGTILNDDSAGAPSVSVGDVRVSEGGVAVFTLLRGGDVSEAASVKVATAVGSASASDFDALSSTVVPLPAGVASVEVEVPTVGDGLGEVHETFSLKLSTPVNTVLADAAAVATIVDDDGAPASFWVDDVVVDEGGTASFTVFRSGETGEEVSVTVATANGTAVAGVDFDAVAPVVVTFGVGETEKPVEVDTIDNGLNPAKNLTFSLKLSKPVGATVADASGLATIVDDEGSPAPPSSWVAASDARVVEGGSLEFTFTRYGDVSGAATVTVSTKDGTAKQPGDYTARVNVPVAFAADEVSKTITVDTVDDGVGESHETLTLTLKATGATLTDTTATGTITDASEEAPVAI